MLSREACEVVQRHRGDAVVVVTMSTIMSFPGAAEDPLTLRVAPLMGGASSIGLGIALARPERRVLVLDGDGSLLMQLGALATIAGARPANLVHLVFNNRVLYEGGGRVPVAGPGVDFTAMAVAAGYPHTHRFSAPEALDAALPDLLSADGPTFVELAIELPPTPRWSDDNPHGELPDWWFTQMRDDAQQVRTSLGPSSNGPN